MSRVNPFDDIIDFAPETKSKSVAPELIDKLAKESGFHSRQPIIPVPAQTMAHRRRHYVTGRNQQLNIKATAETIERFYRLADSKKATLCELLEMALDALEKDMSSYK